MTFSGLKTLKMSTSRQLELYPSSAVRTDHSGFFKKKFSFLLLFTIILLLYDSIIPDFVPSSIMETYIHWQLFNWQKIS